MKQKITTQLIYTISIVCIFSFQFCNSEKILTFRYNNGRFGDVLLNYLKHYYIAELYDLKLHIMTGIPYLNKFALYDSTAHLKQSDLRKNRYEIRNINQIDPAKDDAVYVSHFDLVMGFDTSKNKVPKEFYADYYADLCADFLFEQTIIDPQFRTQVQKLFSPKENISFNLPEGITTVAMHIRQPSNDDLPLCSRRYFDSVSNPHLKNPKNPNRFHDRNYPFKFPPEQYYLDNLIFLYHALGKQPLYVFVFSDSKQTKKLIDRLRKRICHLSGITFDYRQENPESDAIDALCMSKFDYLIRSRSNYSWVSQMIGNHKGIIIPFEGRWDEDFLNITRSVLLIPDRDNCHLYSFDTQQNNIVNAQKTLLNVYTK